MAYEAKEGLNLHVGLRWCTFSDSLYVCIAGSDTLFRYSMGQVIYPFLEEAVFLQFQLEIILPELIKHDTQMMEVFLCSLWEHNQVV